MTSYPSLNRAQLSYDYLHTNSTTHEFLFGAIVELVDNSRDANADRCDIFTVTRTDLRGAKMLCFYDDGCGMSPNEARNVMTFGYSAKRRDPSMIGQYGNGLKSGAMRIGKDMIFFTKKNCQMTCLLLSRTFHEDENIDEVIVPSPSFSANKLPLYLNEGDAAKHKIEMDIILKYSPFESLGDLMIQFDMLKGDHGTLVICYNLKLLENGEPELDFVTDCYDIRLSDPDGGDSSDSKFHLEKISLRSYLAIIYADPRMKLYIQGKKIRTRRIVNCLYKVRSYKFSSAKFKARAEKQIQQAKEQLIAVQERVKEAESKLAEFERKSGTNPTKKEVRAQWRQMQDKVSVSKSDVKRLKDLTEDKIKQLKEPKILNFMFGLNVERRTHDGCFIYNNGRLIRMYEKAGPQLEGTKKCCGVVGVVDIPFVVLEPTHNKQDFADSREYRQLLRAMGEHMDQYWRDMNLAAQPGGLVKFWSQFGFIRPDWTLPPSDEETFIKKRLMSVNLTLQCDLCLKWRILPYESKQAKGEFLDTWTCSQNPDSSYNKCTAPEKLPNFPVGKLEKEIVTVDQKREILEKKIQKQQAELNQIAGFSNVQSKKDISAAELRVKQQKVVQKSAKNSVQAISSTRSSKRTSPSPPPAKKPRTKADLRKQLEEKESESSESSADEQSSEDDQPLKGRPPSLSARTQKKSKSSSSLKIHANTAIPLSTAYSTPHENYFPAADATRRQITAVSPPLSRATVSRPSAATAASLGGKTRAKTGATLMANEEKVASTAPAVSQSGREAVIVPMEGVTFKEKKSAVEVRQFHLTVSHSIELKNRYSKLEAQSTNQSSGDDSAVVVSSSNGTLVNHLAPPTSGSSMPVAQQVEELSSRLRRFLYYFLPPNWTKLSKQQVGQLTSEELIKKVDLAEFFQAYECGLKKLVADHQKTADSALQQLRKLRNLSSTALKQLKPEIDLDQGCENENVEKALEQFLHETNGLNH